MALVAGHLAPGAAKNYTCHKHNKTAVPAITIKGVSTKYVSASTMSSADSYSQGSNAVWVVKVRAIPGQVGEEPPRPHLVTLHPGPM